MGDKILKKYTLLLTLSSLLLAQSPNEDLSWVDKEIEAIKPPRQGVSYRAISLLKDPFVFLHKNKKDKENKQNTPAVVPSPVTTTTTNSVQTKVRKNGPLKLSAVINNSALINGKWYKRGDKVGKYTLVKVSLKEVVLENATKRLKLTTYTKKIK